MCKIKGIRLFFLFLAQMFSKCLQLPFCPDCVSQSQATNPLHFNLVFWVYSLKLTFFLFFSFFFLQDYIHSWPKCSH